MNLSIAIIEDHIEYRTILKEEVDAQEDMICSGCYGAVPTAMDAFRGGDAPDILVLDLGLPKVDGLSAIPDFRKLMPETKILILTISDDRTRVLHALALGAHGYLLKTDPIERILRGIRNIARGEAPMSPAIAKITLETFRRFAPTDQPTESLSERESEVLRALAQGKSRKEVADMLCLSTHTVNNHVRHIYEKLQVHNLSSALRKISEGGLI